MNGLVETPWDRRVLGMSTYEIREATRDVLERVRNRPGHYTVKIDPLGSKRLLHEYGFYYCDTLMEPYCRKDRLSLHRDPAVTIRTSGPLDELLAISHGAYIHGRFHRDFNIGRDLADRRYDNWSKELYENGKCLFLCHDGKIAGYFGVEGGRIVLHAIGEAYRGRGLAKAFWSMACLRILESGFEEVSSSISACNSPILNLYASLGFRFRNPVDIYHLLVRAE